MDKGARHHKYVWTHPFSGSTRHWWELVTVWGGIHFHVSIQDDGKYDPSAGLEFHHVRPIYSEGDAPDHVNCPLTGGRCWHDGTSLYASETLWPLIEPMLRHGEHAAIFRVLETEAADHAERHGLAGSEARRLIAENMETRHDG